MTEINGDLCFKSLIKNQEKKLAYNPANDYAKWKSQIKNKFFELIGMDSVIANACPINVSVEEVVDMGSYTRTRFVFESEVGSFVPCYLCVPKGEKKYPLAIALQGHSSGFHNTIGVQKFEGDEHFSNLDFAVQAVNNGYACLAIEQRAMGERYTNVHDKCSARMCTFLAFAAIELGRTVLAERMWDVSKAIDAMEFFKDQIDLDKIFLMGISGGGTATFYTACFDDRIKLAVPGYAFCTYEDSIMAMYHCPCNMIPSAMRYFEMGDLACLLNGKPVLFIAGNKDYLFPPKGVEKAFATAKAIYKAEGVEDKCRLLFTEQGHNWGGDAEWSAINEEIKKLGWEV